MFEEILSSGISLSRLHTFLRVAEAGNISKAAGEEDANRQSLFSRQIKELEEFFGTELTERRGKSIAISAAGKRLAALIRENFAALDDFQREQKGERRTFVIGAGASLLEWLVCPRMPALLELLPNCTLRVSVSRSLDLVERVRDGRLDFAIVREDAVPEGIRKKTCRKITKASYVLAVPLALAKNSKLPSKPKPSDLARMPLALQLSGGHFHQILHQAFSENSTPLQPTVECESFLQVRATVESGACAGILPAFFTARLDPRQFIILPLPFLQTRVRSLVLHWSERQMKRRAIPDETLGDIARILATDEGSLASS